MRNVCEILELLGIMLSHFLLWISMY